jgi:hypothetical protein
MENEGPESMEEEYDFSTAPRSRHAGSIPRDAVMVVLEPDVAAAFHDSDEVNRALRLLLRLKKELSGAA